LNDYVGVILAAGRGERMGVLGELYPKALLPVANEPIIGHHLRLLYHLGITEVYIIVGHRGAELKGTISDGTRYGLTVRYIEQPTPLGSADAVGRTRPYIRKPFLLILGDYYFSTLRPERLLKRLGSHAQSAIAVKREPDSSLISDACAVEVDNQGRVTNIVEKPIVPKTDLKGCGFYALQPDFFDAIARTPRTALRNEYEITVSLEIYIKAANPVFAEEIIEWDANLTRPEDLLECNLRWLDQQGRNELIGSETYIEEGTQLHRVLVGNRARIVGTSNLKEVVVFPGAQIEGRSSCERALLTPTVCIPCAQTQNSA
jgi:dTDP-glucose pyrophosphorylase